MKDDDDQTRLLIDGETVKRLLKIIQTYSVLQSQSYQLSLAVIILGTVMQVANVKPQLEAFLHGNGLDKFNLIL